MPTTIFNCELRISVQGIFRAIGEVTKSRNDQHTL